MTNATPPSPALTADEISYEIRHDRDAQNLQVFARINGELKHLPALWLRERAFGAVWRLLSRTFNVGRGAGKLYYMATILH